MDIVILKYQNFIFETKTENTQKFDQEISCCLQKLTGKYSVICVFIFVWKFYPFITSIDTINSINLLCNWS